jgi:hypothetical protein
LTVLLAGCAASPQLREARELGAEAPALQGFVDLSQRYRDTYQREQPYQGKAADTREQAVDAGRRAAYRDLIALHTAVTTYLRVLGALAGGERFDPGDAIKDLAKGVKAWPDTGLTDRYVNAVSGLARVLARAVTRRAQEDAVATMLRDGYVPLRDALDAMSAVLRYYDSQHDNEQAIVLGMLDTEIPFAGQPEQRLLAALAKAHRDDRLAEYRLVGRRHTLALQHVASIRARHEDLYRKLDAGAAAPAAPTVSSSAAASSATSAAALAGARP